MAGQTKICVRCHAPFTRNRKYSRSQWENSRFCSTACSGIVVKQRFERTRVPLRDKFEALYSRDSGGCWEWQGTIDGYGYGVIDWSGKRYRAHVLALEYDGRPVGKGGIACHHCDNPRCVRPNHLYPGTPATNGADTARRGRTLRGEKSPAAKLTNAQVVNIRGVYAQYHPTFTSLARAYGVTRPTIARIIHNKTWRQVE